MVYGARGITARLDVILFAAGVAMVGIGELLPYAILATGGVTNPAPLQLVLLGVLGLAFLGVARSRLAWPAMAASALVVALAGYLAVGALRAVSTWSAVWYGVDGSAGPATFVMAGGLVVCAVAVLVRGVVLRKQSRT